MLIDVSVLSGNRIACLRIRAFRSFTASLDEIKFVIFQTICYYLFLIYLDDPPF